MSAIYASKDQFTFSSVCPVRFKWGSPRREGEMCEKISKKCPKSLFLTKNHDFFKVGIRARMADIWPEICIWDVLDTF